MSDVKAKRGDLIIFTRTVSASWIDRPNSSVTEHQVGVVTSVTRDGKVKSYRQRDDSPVQQIDRVIGLTNWAIVPASKIDVAAAMKVAEGHVWPSGHPWMPFDSLEEIRSALRPCLIKAYANRDAS